MSSTLFNLMGYNSSSSFDHQWIHDVFINFRGKDTRKSFVSHLYATLTNAGIKTYMDSQIHMGTELGRELSQAIEGSRIAILVFSKNYTQSSWCLIELEKIMECHKYNGQLVVPVFYDVDPSVVRHQKDDFGKVLTATANKIEFRSGGEEKRECVLSSWRSALTQAANFSGWGVANYRAYVTEILNGCGLHAGIGITLLVERSLVKIEKNNKLGMHDLIRDMGREIVRESSAKTPGKRSRLWLHQDVNDILTKNSGTETVEGLVLKLERSSRVCFCAKSFTQMKNLKLLQLDYVDLTGDYGYLSKELRWVHWKESTFNSIPNGFYLGNLVVIELKHSNIRHVWNDNELLGNLKILNLSHSKCLTSTPDFSRSPNLEKLIMKDCPNLSVVHHSIGDLNSLLMINLKDCTSLSNLPMKIYQLKSLKTLILSGCSKIDKLEEDIVQMESLTTLIAKDTAIEEVPYSIIRSKSIGYISLCGYEGLSRDIFPSLIWSWMPPTMNSLPPIFPFGNMALSLAPNNVQNNNLGFLSPIIRSLSQLRTVCVQYRSSIELTQDLRKVLDSQCEVKFSGSETSNASQISNISSRSLLIGMGSCHTVIHTLGESISKGLTTNDSSDFCLPGGNYPSWLAYTGGRSAKFHVPKNIDCHLKGIVLCVVYSSTSENIRAESLTSILIINYTKCTIEIYKGDTTMSFNDEDWKNVTANLRPGDEVEVFVAFGHGLIVMETGVYLTYGQSVTTEIEQSIPAGVDSSTYMTMEPLAEESAQLSPYVQVEASTNIKINLSPEVKVQSPPIIKMLPSPKANKSILTRLPKRMCACLCMNQHSDKGLNNI